MGQEKSSKLSSMGETEGAIDIYMKKNYVHPVVVELGIEVENCILNSSPNLDVSLDFGSDQKPEGVDDRRDVWGNIWGK